MPGYGKVQRPVVAKCSSAQVIALLTVLACRTWSDGKCNPSLATLAADLKSSRRAVIGWIKQAENDGVLTVQRTKGTSHYTIRSSAESAPLDESSSAGNSTGGVQDVHRGGAGNSTRGVQETSPGNSTSSSRTSSPSSNTTAPAAPSRELELLDGDPAARAKRLDAEFKKLGNAWPVKSRGWTRFSRKWAGLTDDERNACHVSLEAVKVLQILKGYQLGFDQFMEQDGWLTDWAEQIKIARAPKDHTKRMGGNHEQQLLDHMNGDTAEVKAARQAASIEEARRQRREKLGLPATTNGSTVTAALSSGSPFDDEELPI